MNKMNRKYIASLYNQAVCEKIYDFSGLYIYIYIYSTVLHRLTLTNITLTDSPSKNESDDTY